MPEQDQPRSTPAQDAAAAAARPAVTVGPQPITTPMHVGDGRTVQSKPFTPELGEEAELPDEVKAEFAKVKEHEEAAVKERLDRVAKIKADAERQAADNAAKAEATAKQAASPAAQHPAAALSPSPVPQGSTAPQGR